MERCPFIEHKSTNCVIVQAKNFRITITNLPHPEDEQAKEGDEGIKLHIKPKYGLNTILDLDLLNKDYPLGV